MEIQNPQSRIQNPTWLCLTLVMALGAFLLTYRLGEKSYWDDEASAVFHARLPLDGAFLNHDPYHPPLFFVLLHYWRQLGEEEWRLRLLPVFFGFLSIPILFFLARRVAGSNGGIIAAFLLAIAPAFVLYCREVRPYSMLCFSSALSTWLLMVCLGPGRRRPLVAWVCYGLACGAGLAVHHSFMLVFAVQQVFALGTMVLVRFRAAGRPRESVALRGWLLSLFVVLLTLLPWALACASNIRGLFDRATGAEAFAIPYGVAGRLGYMAYVFSLGETVLPWRWPIVAPAALAFGFLFFVGALCVFLGRKGPEACVNHAGTGQQDTGPTGGPRPGILLFALLVLPCLVFAFSSHGAPKYVFGSLPFYSVVCAAGFCALRVPAGGFRFQPGVMSAPADAAHARGRGVKATPHASGTRRQVRLHALVLAALVVVTIADATGLANYFLGRDFHNMAYVEPTREVAGQVLASSRSGDLVVLSQPSRPFALYLEDRLPILFLLHMYDGVPRVWGGMTKSILTGRPCDGDSPGLTPDEFVRLVKREGRRVWFVRRSPGRIGSASEVLRENDEFEKVLNERLRKRLHWRVCFDPEAPTKRLWIRAKPFMDHRIEVTLYGSE
ncbi:MAG: glycosyltransferase family 39 protein [Planctomycetota bacterium]|nr:glycosyltransferase family 39 protein [Planctomycetota bacterium]